MRSLALVIVVVVGRVAAADGSAKPKCDPFSSFHNCNDMDTAGAPAPATVTHTVSKPHIGPKAKQAEAANDHVKCDPFSAMHNCGDVVAQAGSAAGAMPAGEPAVPSPQPAKPTAAQLRQTCADAMNADPSFKESIQNSIDKQIDQQVLAAHEDADLHIQKNEKHVIIAYAALWALAALFVVFLWLRQLGLKREIEALKRDLDAAAASGKETAK